MTLKGAWSKKRNEKWMEHAKGRPITAWIWIKTKGFADEFLARHMAQVEDLSLTFPAKERQKSNPKLSVFWPSIISGIVSLDLQNVALTSSQLTSVFRADPRLERLIVVHDDDPIEHSFTIPPANGQNSPTRLTHLQLKTGFEDVDEMCDLLRLCPNLNFLSLDPIHVSDSNGNDSSNQVDLPSLLAASLPIVPLARQLIPRLNTPALQCMLFNHDLSCKALEAGIQDDSLYAKCKVLELSHQLFYLQDLLFFLGRMPCLQDLAIRDMAGNLDPLVTFLTTPDENGRFPLPVLRRLTITNNHYWGGSLNGFERRYEGIPSVICQIPPPLEEVEIYNCWVCGGSNAAMRLFQKHGTKFSMDCCWGRS